MNSLSPNLTKRTQQEWLHNIFFSAIENGLSTALWRLPNSNQYHALVTATVEYIDQKKSLEELPAGFVFAPFSKSSNRIYLKGDDVFSFENGLLKSNDEVDDENLPQWLKSQLNKPTINTKFHQREYTAPIQNTDYKELVAKSITTIASGVFEKVVASRVKKIDLSNDFDPVKAFNELSIAYPNAFISLVSIAGIGTWLGASPEILVQVKGDLFSTVSLAGSQPLKSGTTIQDVAWKQKEIEEQALVSRYIINCFKKIRLREFEEQGPKTIVAGNILHLKTDFIVDMKATNFPQLGSVMLELLHPTSAVCGMPLDHAFEFIIQNEGYDREFYSGYLGPVNFDDEIHLFVNLRCLQLLEKEAVIYAGAGITRDSEPSKEWEETELKMNTLLQIIRK